MCQPLDPSAAGSCRVRGLVGLGVAAGCGFVVFCGFSGRSFSPWVGGARLLWSLVAAPCGGALVEPR